MTDRYRLTPAALRDLDAIADYTLAQCGADQMDRYIRSLMDRCAWLADHPDAGRRRPDIHHDYLCFPEGKHLVFYLSRPTEIIIIGIVHQSMDVIAGADIGLGPGNGRLAEEGHFVPEGVLLEVAAVVLAAVFRGEADPKGRANLFEFADPADDLEFAEAPHDLISCSLRGSMTNARGWDGLRSTAKSEGPLRGNRFCG